MRPVVTVSEDTDIAEIGKLFTTLQIKRVPVTREGRVTGIVARADLVRVIASQQTEGPKKRECSAGRFTLIHSRTQKPVLIRLSRKSLPRKTG